MGNGNVLVSYSNAYFSERIIASSSLVHCEVFIARQGQVPPTETAVGWMLHQIYFNYKNIVLAFPNSPSKH